MIGLLGGWLCSRAVRPQRCGGRKRRPMGLLGYSKQCHAACAGQCPEVSSRRCARILSLCSACPSS